MTEPVQAAPDVMLDDLLDYVRAKNRVCPQPKPWAALYELLPNRHQKPTGGWEPPLPLILGAWWHTDDNDKRQCLRGHIQYAAAHGALDAVNSFLRGLPEDDWYYLT